MRTVINFFLFGLTCALLVGSVFLITKFDTSYFQFKDLSAWGTFGDYIGGIVGTIFGLVSVVLLYYTFQEQRRTSVREKFENKYYELIKLHRENVSELTLGKEAGKKVFILLIREFREVMGIVKELDLKYNERLGNEKIMELSYLILFYGIGPNSTRILLSASNTYKRVFLEHLVTDLERKKNIVKGKRNFDYTPFEGHQSRLGHYFRHLYQTIKFVEQSNFKFKDKKDYVKTIRAQLSNHEQALLFFNSISRLGKAWRKNNLIDKYSLIKNLPKNFIDEINEIDVKAIYPNLIFEWEESKQIRHSIIDKKFSIFRTNFQIRFDKFEDDI